MTQLTINLPEDLEQRARDAGLLSDSAIQGLIEDAMRRQARQRLRPLLRTIHAAVIPPMSMDEIAAEVKAVRARRALGASAARS